MADPRFYRVDLPAVDKAAALAVARQIVVACARPPITITAWGTLSAPSVATVAAAVPSVRIDAGVTVAPGDVGALTEWVRDPRVDNWFAVQQASAFGSAFWVGSRAAYENDRASSVLSLFFEAEPGRERDEQCRLERWLRALAAAGPLPVEVALRQLVKRFFAEVAAGPTVTGIHPKRIPWGPFRRRLPDGIWVGCLSDPQGSGKSTFLRCVKPLE